MDSRARREGDNARLVSKELPQTSPNKKCLRFFYHMFGRTMGSLSVYLVPSGQTKKFLFTKTGSQKDDWKLAELNLNVDKPYQVLYSSLIPDVIVLFLQFDWLQSPDSLHYKPADENKMAAKIIWRSKSKWRTKTKWLHLCFDLFHK